MLCIFNEIIDFDGAECIGADVEVCDKTKLKNFEEDNRSAIYVRTLPVKILSTYRLVISIQVEV